MSDKAAKRISQPTSFGNPDPDQNFRFYKLAAQWLGRANGVLYPLAITSLVLFLALLVYTGVAVDSSNIFVSDGTVFSCQIDSVKVVRK